MRILLEPPYRHAAVVISVAMVMAALFAASYSLALGRPTPHHIPAGLVGDPTAHPELIAGLEQATHDGLTLRPYPSRAAAERAVAEQQIYAVLVISGQPPQLLIASAATSVARVLEQAANAVGETAAAALRVRDLRPLPPGDPQGLVSFYVTLAATILGFVTRFKLRANAPATVGAGLARLRRDRGYPRRAALTIVVDPVIGALRGPFFEL